MEVVSTSSMHIYKRVMMHHPYSYPILTLVITYHFQPQAARMQGQDNHVLPNPTEIWHFLSVLLL